MKKKESRFKFNTRIRITLQKLASKFNIFQLFLFNREFLGGFHKRKLQRRKKAQEELQQQLKEEKKRIKKNVSFLSTLFWGYICVYETQNIFVVAKSIRNVKRLHRIIYLREELNLLEIRRAEKWEFSNHFYNLLKLHVPTPYSISTFYSNNLDRHIFKCLHF